MARLHELIARVVHDVETDLDALKYALIERFGGFDEIHILPYTGFGNDHELFIRGRVLEDHGITSPLETDGLWDNLVNMYKRIDSDEIPGAQLSARYQGHELRVSANEEGFFELIMPVSQPLPADEIWAVVDLELIQPKQEKPVHAKARALVAPPSAGYIVISDIDDTVLVSDAADMFRMARNMFLGNARTRLPFPGVAAFYRALYEGTGNSRNNPLFYVSSSPWNLYDFLTDFFDLQGIPIGPVLFLRDWGVTQSEVLPLDNNQHKLKYIRRILDFFPHLPCILIGDSTQQDPEIYADIVSVYGDRIMATYIRNVEATLKRSDEIKELAKKVIEAGSTLILADDTLELAKHAAEMGWIDPARLAEIRGEKLEDEKPEGPIESLKQEKADAPTAVIDAGERAQARQAEAAVEGGAIDEIIEKEGKEAGKKPPTVIVKGEEKPREGDGT